MSEQLDLTQDPDVFTADQQKFVDKLVGKARIDAREQASVDAQTAQAQATTLADQKRMEDEAEWQKLSQYHADRVAELEPLAAQIETYETAIKTMLKERLKAFGDAAKKAVEALPGALSNLEKLTWLNASEGLFTQNLGDQTPNGTPAKRKKTKTAAKTPKELGHRRSRF